MFLLLKFDNSSPSHAYELMTHYLLKRSTQWNLLIEVYLLSKFDDSSFSMTENIQIFKLVILQTLSSQSWYSFCWLWASQYWSYLFFFSNFGQVTVILLSLGSTVGRRKQSKPTPFDKKNQEPPIGSGTSHFPWFNQQ